ncbi:peptidase M24, structural domain-containing protein [Phascolomyces articulosus]|uniref:Peptidase M24, structural domain-containing protein n=1 Tax=Phascolomyces articulosus TaxID=60185 RepID=A0AAD5PBP9_9FUNG|nr:peptidase M24, structural domain-containing protein [Phascolomyces articulosus]
MTPHPVPLRLPHKIPTRQHCYKVMKLMNHHEIISAATSLKTTPLLPRMTQQQHQDHPQDEKAFIFLPGAVDSVRDGTDVELEFRQSSDFYYLTGVDEPGFCVMIDLQTELVYLIPPTVPESETVWKGTPETPSELLQKYDIDCIILDETELSDILLQHGYHKVYVMDTFFSHHPHNEENILRRMMEQRLPPFDNTNKKLQFDTYTLRLAMNEARLTKFPYEINMIRQATLVSSHAHMALWQHRHQCTTEAHLAAYFRWMCSCSGLDRQAYIPIVASGPRAAILHYTRNNKPLSIHPHQPSSEDKHSLILVDAGAEYRCYGSDITRTFPVTGKFSPEAKTIYNIVLAMQEAVLAKLSPGVYWTDMEDLAIQILCNELVRIGILVGDPEELIHLGIPYAFYFHSLGHSVGLDVHDVGGRKAHPSDNGDHKLEYSPFMVDRPLEPNMVITVEPGLYFNDTYLRIWSQYPGFGKYFDTDQLQRYRPVGGVRIEDSVLITSNGCENLTIAPKRPEEIEAIMASTSLLSASTLSKFSDVGNNNNPWTITTIMPFPYPIVSPCHSYFGENNHSSPSPSEVSPSSSSTTTITTMDTTGVLPTPSASPLHGSYCFSEE